ncbi:cupin domain-containing protein [Flagellimonas taeanensis]|uniref:cupin domain-containing protein n=1 Tax=Flavobacteriaceae TaxID=49546 RepID=UPI000E699D13|nr:MULTISPECIES: cupin domain-containing protein [Allomuricauda]MDC6385894.1 cupin domain-containing protein [Muricauda sp. SK9]RIV50820.1 cupin domain-containing protein [Allomuricauda taeanensis]
MSTNIFDYIVNSHKMEWQPLIENGIHYKGVFVKSLRYDESTKRSPSILLKFEPGASYPYHNHPGGEELFMLKGSCKVNEAFLEAGDYLYTPTNYKHGVTSENGCEFMLNIPQEVEIL